MKKNLVGIYHSSFDAIEAIHSMKQIGDDKSHIYVIVKDESSFDPGEEKIDNEIKDEKTDKQGLWSELKTFLSSRGNQLYPDGIEMPNSTVNTDVEDGKIVVLVDNEVAQSLTNEMEFRSEHSELAETKKQHKLIEKKERAIREKEYEIEVDPFSK